MLLWLLERLAALWPSLAWSGDLAGLEKITLRGSLAAVGSFLLAVLLGPRLIAWLHRRFREPIKSDSAEICRLHRHKEATPTMGGLFVVAGLVTALLACGDLANGYVLAALAVAIGLARLGMPDDLTKPRGRSTAISVRAKLAGQIAVALAAALVVYHHHAGTADGLTIRVPLVGAFSLGLWFIPWAATVVVAASNAVNLTDGLDGLAGGCLIFAAAAMAVAAYAVGHSELAAYLRLAPIPGAGEMAVLAGAVIGGVLGFLWFNCHPAQVFLGDTGSLPLGGLLGLMAVVARQEFLLLLVGGVFVAEAASVIIQVGCYKWRRRRVFLCAPLHHHFQLKGWPETRIVVRFWIAAALCAVVGLGSLKLRVSEPADRAPASLTACDDSPTTTTQRPQKGDGGRDPPPVDRP